LNTPNGNGALRIDVQQNDEGTVYQLTVDRPRRLNILDTALLAEFAAALARIDDDDAARVAVLDGAGGKAWIGGADIKEMAGLDPDSAREFIGRLHGLCAGLRALPIPVIARIDGFCLGAGVEVAARRPRP
jgi:enoyl-CoA hydratase/carnithine racemase